MTYQSRHSAREGATTLNFTPPLAHTGLRQIDVRSRSGAVKGACVTSGDRRVLPYESLLEKKVALCAMAHPDVVEVHSQRPYVEYVDDEGSARGHYFDLSIVTRDGTKIAVAVRPMKRALRAGLLRKLELIAGQIPPAVADRVVLATEKDVPPDAVHNAALIHAVRRDPPSQLDSEIADIVSTIADAVSIAALVERSGKGAEAFRSIVRLIGAGTLVAARTGRIDYATPVRRRVQTREVFA